MHYQQLEELRWRRRRRRDGERLSNQPDSSISALYLELQPSQGPPFHSAIQPLIHRYHTKNANFVISDQSIRHMRSQGATYHCTKRRESWWRVGNLEPCCVRGRQKHFSMCVFDIFYTDSLTCVALFARMSVTSLVLPP